MAVLIFVLVLSFLVIIHELGHFFAARWAGITVHEFGLGYPPKARKLFTWLGTQFTLNWIPFGGFVRMAGEGSKPEDKPKKGEYYAAKTGPRMVVVLAGVIANFIFGILAFAVVFTFTGIPVEVTTARIGLVAPGSPAAQAGVPVNVDVLGVTIAGQTTYTATTNDVIQLVQQHQGETVTLVVSGTCKNGSCQESMSEHQVYVRTPEETPAGEGAMGVAFDSAEIVVYPWYQMPFRGIIYGFKQALMMTGLILQSLQNLVSGLLHGQVSEELSGPVGIVYQAQQYGIFDQGWSAILAFAGMLSINLAIMNILPIPPLDGGRAVLTIAEAISGRKRTAKLEYYLNYGGYVLLIGLIVLVTARDVVNVVRSLFFTGA